MYQWHVLNVYLWITSWWRRILVTHSTEYVSTLKEVWNISESLASPWWKRLNLSVSVNEEWHWKISAHINIFCGVKTICLAVCLIKLLDFRNLSILSQSFVLDSDYDILSYFCSIPQTGYNYGGYFGKRFKNVPRELLADRRMRWAPVHAYSPLWQLHQLLVQ